jgi:peptidylprolyl isomerase
MLVVALVFTGVLAIERVMTQAQSAPLKSDTYLDDTSLITGTPCAAPCWNKMTPGLSKLEEAQTILKADSRFANVGIKGSGNILTATTAAGVVCCDITADRGGIIRSIQMRVAPKMQVKQLIEKFGEPAYLTTADYSPTEVAVALIFPKVGVVAWASPGDPTSALKPESPIVIVVYFSMDQVDNLVKTARLQGWSGYVAYSAIKAATPIVTPLPPPTAPPQPTVVASDADKASPCFDAPIPSVTPITNAPRSFTAPEKVTDTAKTYCGFVATERGVIVIELYIKDAPQHVNSFAFLANKGYYDGITWHRVISGFVAQTGDPTGTGSGGPGYLIPLETQTLLKYDRPGLLGMARTNDPNSAGSQFFITYAPQPNLNPTPNGGYTIFGRVVKGFDVVQSIRPRDQGQPPGDKLVWARVTEAPVK